MKTMCGIVGYVGKRRATPILLEGLKRLEYRGYDSAGIALVAEKGIYVKKTTGNVGRLVEALTSDTLQPLATLGIGHTRWATHGEPNEANAHPHIDCTERIAIVHNGTLENHEVLRTQLEERGHVFRSATDTEVLAHLIEEFLGEEEKVCFLDAFVAALKKVVGSYAVVAMWSRHPENLYVACLSSTLKIGIGENEKFVASDSAAFLGEAKSVIDLEDWDVAVLTPHADVSVINQEGKQRTLQEKKLKGTVVGIQKGIYPHFMLKEIHEQPSTILDTMRGRVRYEEGNAWLGGLKDVEKILKETERFVIIACGTSWHAGLVGRFMLEDLAHVPTIVEYASEFQYRASPVVVNSRDVVLVISQSGETADTLGALRFAKRAGATVLGIVNVVGSTISRETDAGVYLHAGPEIGVASTKAFTSQITALMLIALMTGRMRGTIPIELGREICNELREMPRKVQSVLENSEEIRKIAHEFRGAKNFLYLGRGTNFPAALEGALKLKEISYIHAEGYPAAEMKHGPIALVDESMPVVFLVPKDPLYKKMMNNLQEVKARKGRIIAIANEDDVEIESCVDANTDFIIRVPRTFGTLGPIVNSIPLQLLAYYIAVERGLDPDKPRNLAKSVTVE